MFGPVLHVVRYRRERLDALVDAINATGYGLTLGVHSRIDETVERVDRSVRASATVRQPQHDRRRRRRAAVRRRRAVGHRTEGRRAALCAAAAVAASAGGAGGWRASSPVRSASATAYRLAAKGTILCVARDPAEPRRSPMRRGRPAIASPRIPTDPHSPRRCSPAAGTSFVALNRRLAARDGPIVPVLCRALSVGIPGRRGVAQRQHGGGRRQCQPDDDRLGRPG